MRYVLIPTNVLGLLKTTVFLSAELIHAVSCFHDLCQPETLFMQMDYWGSGKTDQ